MTPRLQHRQRHLCLLPVLLLVGAATGWAQRLPLRTYSSDDGLGRSVILAMTQDQAGFLWIATPEGVSRFDGFAFTNAGMSEGLPHDVVRSLLAEGDGTIWVGTENGLARSSGEAWEQPLPELSGHSIRCLARTPDGSLWVGTYGAGVARVAGGAVTFFTTAEGLAHDRVRTAAVDAAGTLWLGTYGGGVSRWNGAGFTTFGTAAGLADLEVRAMLAIPGGGLLVGTNGGPFRLVGDRFERFAPATALADLAITAILADHLGRLWFGTRDAGACHLADGTLSCLGVAEGLPDASVNTLFEDSEGNLWFGTLGGGVSRLVSESLRIYTSGDGLPRGGVQAFGETGEAIWFGTHGGGVSRLEDGVFTTFSAAAGLPHDKVFSIATGPRGEVWVGTLSGAARIEGDRIVRFEHAVLPTPDNVVFSILADAAGEIWMGTLSGLLNVHRDGSVTRYDTASGLPTERVNRVVAARSGGLWVATAGGLVRFRGGRIDTPALPGLADAYIVDVLEQADGTLWIATTRGLGRLRDGAVRVYTTADGLTSDRCSTLLEDAGGVLWVGTSNGINILHDDVFTVFTARQGLPSSEVMPGGGFKDSRGRLWFGTNRGAVVFAADVVRRSVAPPTPVISALRVDDEPVATTDAMTLAHDRSSLHIEFEAPCFWAPDDLRYRFQLTGVDPRPRITTARFSDYPGLPPGRYDFSLEAACGGAEWSPVPARLAIRVTPPIWQLWWFRLVVAGVVVALVLSVHQARLATARRRQRWLEQVVEERTGELVAERREVRQKNQQLRVVDEVVAEINRQLDFTTLIEAILGGVAAVAGSGSGLGLVRHGARPEFLVAARHEWPGLPAGELIVTEAEVEQRVIALASRLGDGLFLGRASDATADEEGLGRLPATFLVLAIDLDGGSEGYLLVAGDEARLTDPQCLQTLQGLGGHIRSAFIKGRLVRQLRELNQTKNEFLGIAAHDLRSPLSSVISFSGLLIKQLEQDRLERERAHRFLVNINTAATQMLTLVEDLLDVAAIESGRVELRLGRHSLADIVRERCALAEPAARGKGIALSAETAAAEHTVLVDRVRLGEVLDNLLGNSLKFTHSGGQVRVWCEDRGSEVAVHVADTGVGLNDDELAKVFTGQRLSARPTGGESSTGLGLVIVRKLVEEHGGRIRVRSQRGVGTTFTLTLPFDDTEGDAEPTPAAN